ncbi:conserved hypothetical protein [Neospora caninum Liverpool]|uniref:Transmembrane protein n=1 Tax=Neospora caninum (strain Liverpool) TaxID=572307 RepID=F0VNF9_NEOCL|nr:conserved hypothetical protein [Neospora caninum Liverpool]CBZ55255.1 conserved hypothetical protein [Neospora caninum Liverpool]CEL69986.1 TPA: hypothetical protein BN1204_056790 [Neospora caninum Liverpool]|eukprot:XP_003885283.1 conserved hypothetical protein [Neospora caninum Liverpool]
MSAASSLSPSPHLSRLRTFLPLVFLIVFVCSEQTWRGGAAARSVGFSLSSVRQRFVPVLSPAFRSPIVLRFTRSTTFGTQKSRVSDGKAGTLAQSQGATRDQRGEEDYRREGADESLRSTSTKVNATGPRHSPFSSTSFSPGPLPLHRLVKCPCFMSPSCCLKNSVGLLQANTQIFPFAFLRLSWLSGVRAALSLHWSSSPSAFCNPSLPASSSSFPPLFACACRLPRRFSLSSLSLCPSQISRFSPGCGDFPLLPSRPLSRCSSPLYARKPKPKAEKRARNFQRAFEEREKNAAREAKRRLLLQREWYKQQEADDRKREEERRELAKKDIPVRTQGTGTPGAPSPSSVSTGSRTLTELAQQAISTSGQALKHRENWVIVGSTQRRARRRDRLPYSQRDFVKKVFTHLPEDELEKEVRKAERAWRGDMLLDELEEEIGGPDALAPGGGVGGFVR